MYLSAINYQSQLINNYKMNNLSMKAKKVPYCLDTSIYDTFLKRLENLNNTFLSKDTKILIDKNFENELINSNSKGIDMKALVDEMQIPIYKITAQDFIDKRMKMELAHAGEDYMYKTFTQLKNKFMNTGERSVLYFENLDEILRDGNSSYNDIAKTNTLMQLLQKAKQNGIIPVFSIKDLSGIDSRIQNLLKGI